jgi:hypothetical protein
MNHEANQWITSNWLGKTVRQTAVRIDTCAPMPGSSTVVDTMWDEKGALHLQMANGYWCPAAIMEIVK